MQLRFSRKQYQRLLAIISVAAMGPLYAYAFDFNYGLSAGYRLSDNITQTFDPQNGSEADYGFNFNLLQNDIPSVTLNASGNFAIEDYHGVELQTNRRRNFDASMVFQPVRSNFSALVIDSYSQQSADRLSGQEVGNFSDINVFSVIPRYSLNISSADRIEIDYMYARVTDIDRRGTAQDASRRAGRTSIGFDRDYSSRLTLGLHARASDVDFDIDVPSYQYYEGIVRVAYDYESTRYVLNWGATELQRENIQDEQYRLIEFSLIRQLNRNNSVDLAYEEGVGREFNLDLTGTMNISADDDVGYLNEPVTRKRANVGYRHAGFKYIMNLDVYGRELKSIDAMSVRDEMNLGVEFLTTLELSNLFSFAARSNLRFGYSTEKSEFPLESIAYKTHRYNLGLSYFSSPSMEYILDIQSRHVDGQSTGGNSDENSVMVGFRFSPVGRR